MKSKILALSKNEEFKTLLKKKKLSNMYVTFFFGVEDNKNIWVMNEDGSDPRQVTNGVNIGDGFPSFSPDGSELVFQSTSENESTLINIIKIDGSDFRKVGEGFFPNWSPYLD